MEGFRAGEPGGVGEGVESERQFEEVETFLVGVLKTNLLCALYVAGVCSFRLEIPAEEKKDEVAIAK